MKNCNRCKSDSLVIESEHKFHDVYKCLVCNYLMPIGIEDCCKHPFLNVTVDDKNPERRRLHWQCITCGGCVDRTKPMGFKKHQQEIRYEFSHYNFEKWNEERGNEATYLRESVKGANTQTSRFGKYTTYINSENWKIKRREALIRDKNLCQECKNKPAEDVHHKTYDNLYNEPLEDLISLCRECHTEIHRVLNIEEMKKIRAQIEINIKGSH